MRHRVPQQVWVELHSDQGSVLAAQIPHATISQWTSLANEDQIALHGWASLQVCLHGTTSKQRQRNASLLGAFSEPKYNCAAALTQHQVAEFEDHKITDPATREQEKSENGIRPDVATKFDLPQQLPNLGPI